MYSTSNIPQCVLPLAPATASTVPHTAPSHPPHAVCPVTMYSTFNILHCVLPRTPATASTTPPRPTLHPFHPCPPKNVYPMPCQNISRKLHTHHASHCSLSYRRYLLLCPDLHSSSSPTHTPISPQRCTVRGPPTYMCRVPMMCVTFDLTHCARPRTAPDLPPPSPLPYPIHTP